LTPDTAKLEKRANLVDLSHWLFINDLLSRVDILYLGDIKSHDIVSGGKNRTLNRAFNDLKFYQLKMRPLYKAGVLGKHVHLTPEPYTTKTCSRCGVINDHVGSKEVFECPCCNLVTGRDINAAKNTKMKGILS
jgi:putative transposase